MKSQKHEKGPRESANYGETELKPRAEKIQHTKEMRLEESFESKASEAENADDIGQLQDEVEESEETDSIISKVTERSDSCQSITAGDHNMLMNENKTNMTIEDRGKRLKQVLQMINQKNVHQPNRIDDGEDGLKVNTAVDIHRPRHKYQKQTTKHHDSALMVSLVSHELGEMINHAYAKERANCSSQASVQSQYAIDDRFIDEDNDSPMEVGIKRELINAFNKPSKQRTPDELVSLLRFHMKYKFFMDQALEYGEDSILAIMKHIKGMRLPANSLLFEEGEEGDKFYIVLKGLVGVDIAKEVPVQFLQQKHSIEVKVQCYVQMLYDNQDRIFWPKVPYALKIQEYFRQYDLDRSIFIKLMMEEIYELIGKNYVYLFQWAKQAAKSKQDPHMPVARKAVGIFTAIKKAFGGTEIISNSNNSRSTLKSIRTGQSSVIGDEALSKENSRDSTPNPVVQGIRSQNSQSNPSKLSGSRQSPTRLSPPIRESKESKTVANIVTPQGTRYSKYHRFDSYLSDKKLRKWARSNQLIDMNTEMNQQLKTRLERLATIIDLSVVYLNTEVAQLKDGAPFGELALKSSEDRRAASIAIKEDTFLAYLDRTDYNMVMKRVMRAKTQRQLQILRSHKLFAPVSQNKLQLFQLNLVSVKLYMNQVLWNEGDEANGMYLLLSGSVKYQKTVDYETPIEAKSSNKWFRESIQSKRINRKTLSKDVAIFEHGDLIGFEEIFRDYIQKTQNEQEMKTQGKAAKDTIKSKSLNGKTVQDTIRSHNSSFNFTNSARDFKLVCNAANTVGLYMSRELIMPIIKSHSHLNQGLLEQIFKERAVLLQRSLDNQAKQTLIPPRMSTKERAAQKWPQIKVENQLGSDQDINELRKHMPSISSVAASSILTPRTTLGTQFLPATAGHSSRSRLPLIFQDNLNQKKHSVNIVSGAKPLRNIKDRTPIRHDNNNLQYNACVQETKSDHQLELQGSIDSIVAGTFKDIQSLQGSREQLHQPNPQYHSIQITYPTNCSVPNMQTLPVESHSGDPFVRRSEVALNQLINSGSIFPSVAGNESVQNLPRQYSIDIHEQLKQVYYVDHAKESTQFKPQASMFNTNTHTQLQSERASRPKASSSQQANLGGGAAEVSHQADSLLAASRNEDQLSTRLFLKDVKTFMGIQKAANNCVKRKHETSENIRNQPNQLMITERAAMRNKKILYQGIKEREADAEDLDPELTGRLCGVLQSLQTERFYKVSKKTGKKESEQDFLKRQEKNIQGSMDQIDDCYNQMDIDEHGRTFKKAELLDLQEFAKILGNSQRKKRKMLIDDLTDIDEERKLKTSRIHKGTLIANVHNKEMPMNQTITTKYGKLAQYKLATSLPVSRKTIRPGPKYDVKLIMKNQDLFNIKINNQHQEALQDQKDGVERVTAITVPTHIDEDFPRQQTQTMTMTQKQAEVFQVKNIVASPLSLEKHFSSIVSSGDHHEVNERESRGFRNLKEKKESIKGFVPMKQAVSTHGYAPRYLQNRVLGQKEHEFKIQIKSSNDNEDDGTKSIPSFKSINHGTSHHNTSNAGAASVPNGSVAVQAEDKTPITVGRRLPTNESSPTLKRVNSSDRKLTVKMKQKLEMKTMEEDIDQEYKRIEMNIRENVEMAKKAGFTAITDAIFGHSKRNQQYGNSFDKQTTDPTQSQTMNSQKRHVRRSTNQAKAVRGFMTLGQSSNLNDVDNFFPDDGNRKYHPQGLSSTKNNHQRTATSIQAGLEQMKYAESKSSQWNMNNLGGGLRLSQHKQRPQFILSDRRVSPRNLFNPKAELVELKQKAEFGLAPQECPLDFVLQ